MRPFRITATIVPLYLFCLATLAVWTQFSPLWAALLACLAILVWRRPAAGAALLFFTLPADAVRPLFGNVFISFSEIAFGSCVLVWLAGRVVQEGRRPIDWRALIWGAPFVVAVGLSALLNNEWSRVLPHVLRASELVFACWFSCNAWQVERERSVYRLAIGAGAVFYSLVGFSQIFVAHNARVYSMLGNPNQFAAYLNLLFPFLVVFLFRGAGGGKWWLPVVALTTLGALAAQSRAALLGLFLAFHFVLIHTRRESIQSFFRRPVANLHAFLRRRWDTLVLVFFYTCLGLFALDSVNPRIVTRVFVWVGAYRERSSQGVVQNVIDQRLPFFRLGMQVWRERPLFGIGPGNYEGEIVRRWGVVAGYQEKIPFFDAFQAAIRSHVHNLGLQLAVDYGLVGLFAFLYFLARIALLLWKHRNDSDWCIAGLAVLVAFAVVNLVDVTVYSLGMETGFVLGVSMPGSEPKRDKRRGH